MNRRETLGYLAAMAGAGTLPLRQASARERMATEPRPKIAMLIHPKMVLLDHVPAHTVFALTMSDIDLVWKSREAVATDIGVPLAPTKSFAEATGDYDVLFVPGGLGGTIECMEDGEVIGFLKAKAANARFVTSVCTGSLLLAAAGLLKGYKATGHWHSCELLPLMGATLQRERVVVDRNRITGGGVTAGLDFGLQVAAMLRSPEWARTIQLILEYDPHPPFQAGSPAGAGAEVVNATSELLTPQLLKARAVAERVAKSI